MNGVALTLSALHRGEEHLADRLTAAAERHREEPEIHHVATDLAHWSREHSQRVAETAGDRDMDLDADNAPGIDFDDPAGTREMLAQAAQATKDDEVLDLASACHPRTLRQMRWTNAMIKSLSPQILSSP